MSSKYQDWWDTLPEHTKEYLKKQPLWHDKDLYKFGAGAAIIGFVIGVLMGYEWAFKPIANCFRPLVG